MSYQPQRPPALVMRRGPRPNQAFPLHKTVLTLGRAADNDIVIDDAEVSRHHARLTLRGNDWILEDLGSRNGTLVNGQRITGPVVLTPGSQVALGPDVLFSMEGGVPVAAMPRRPVARRSASRWLFLAGLAVLVVAVLAGAAVLAYSYLNPPVIEARDAAELFSTGPDIAFQEPAPGTEVGLGGSVLVFATARDEDRVTRVDLWVDDQLVVQQFSPEFDGVTPLSLIHKLVATTPGTHSLLVRAYDSLGAMGESPTLHVTVLEEPEPAPTTAQYVVQPGDTPAKVALVMSTTVVAIQGENPGMGQVITPGQTIVVPAPPAQPKPQAGGPVDGGPGPGPVDGGPPQPVHPPISRSGQVTGVIPGMGVLSPSVQFAAALPGLLPSDFAQIDPTKIQFPIGDAMQDPPHAIVKKPYLEEPVAGDCTVTLRWQAGQQGEEYQIWRDSTPGVIPTWHKIDRPPGQTTYTDNVPSPGQYGYVVVAITEINRRRFEARSNYWTVTVSPSAKCIPVSQYKLVHFQPIEFKSSKFEEGALFVTVEGITRRIPSTEGKHHPVGDWSSKKEEVWPALVSVYLDPNAPLSLAVQAEGKGKRGGHPRPDLGSFDRSFPQSELGPGKKLTGGNENFELTYRFWVEDVKWGQRQTTDSIKAPRLKVAKSKEELRGKAIKDCPASCDASRVLLWDWTGDKDDIDGYILYRGYSCPGQKGESKAPLVLQGSYYQGINIPPQTEPVGCVARFQVSAFGPAGESELSNEQVWKTATAASRVPVTFKNLALNRPATDRIHLWANGYRRSSENDTVGANTLLPLEGVLFSGQKPNHVLTVNLDEGEALQFGLLMDFCRLEKTLDPPKPGNYPLYFKEAQGQGECWGTVEVGALEAVPAGEIARPEADISNLHWPFLVGKDIYKPLSNEGPDQLPANRVELTSYWVEPGKDKPLFDKQTITHWWNPYYDGTRTKVGSISDIEKRNVNLKDVEFYVEVTALDFDDPDKRNNVWQGELQVSKTEPAKREPGRRYGWSCSFDDECIDGQCADGKRCAPLPNKGQDGDYCHNNNHCEGFCLCKGQYDSDGDYCLGWEEWNVEIAMTFYGWPVGMCRSNDQPGAPCSNNDDCESKSCIATFDGNRCVPKDGTGKRLTFCTQGDQCESRACQCLSESEPLKPKEKDKWIGWASPGAPRCVAGPGLCLSRLSNGADCKQNENCESGNCDDGKCAPKRREGETGDYCHRNDHCAVGICSCFGDWDGDFCAGWESFDEGHHATCPLEPVKKSNGKPCRISLECQSGNCDDGKCAPQKGRGEAGEYCHRDEHCRTFCLKGKGKDEGKCFQLSDLGDQCRKHSECESGYCADTFLGGGWGRCARDRDGKSGEYCHHDNHCASGECECRRGWWPGFCADWEGWGRWSVKGTCK